MSVAFRLDTVPCPPPETELLDERPSVPPVLRAVETGTFAVPRVPVAGPWVTDKELAYVADAAKNDWYERAGTWVTRFERAFAAQVERRFAMALPSCTSGLHLALLALGIGPGDEVIVPELTWIATAAPITYLGATPVFADVDPKTWTMTKESLMRCVGPRTRAAIPVALYGSMPDWKGLREAAKDARIALVEDAAEAIGSYWRGRPAGAFGDASVFSFHGSKTITTGEGGMLVTNDERLFVRAQTLRDHGRRPGDVAFFNAEVGHKYKMTSLQAAFGAAQLERLDEIVAKKREIFSWYAHHLAGLEGVTLNAEPEGVLNSYWMVTAVLDPSFELRKEELAERLSRRGIDTRPFFHPLSSLPAFAHASDTPRARRYNQVAYALSPFGINLPSALSLEERDVARVCRSLRDVLGR